MTRRVDPVEFPVAATPDDAAPDQEAGHEAGHGIRHWGERGTARASFASNVTLDAVGHAYGATPSLRDVSFDIAPAETVCLLGQSGCGKTTLLRIIAGIEAPASGRVLFDGREVSSPREVEPPERRGVGLMFQDFALFPHLTILDNVTFGLKALPRAEAEREALAVLRRVGLEDAARSYPHALSGGEQQRIALARAIVPRPGIILMDEPFSGLDPGLRNDIRDETLAILRETRSTAVIVTHDPEEAMRVADRIILMRQGVIVQMGTAEDLYLRPADLDTARFFSDVNEFPGRVERGWVSTAIGTFPCAGLGDGAQVVACVRPPSVRLVPAGEAAAGRITRRRFVGEVDLVEVAVEGLRRPVFARDRARRFDAGQDVGVCVDPQDVMVFPDKATA